MARSTYIYLLVSGTKFTIIHGCFTVKYEAEYLMEDICLKDKGKNFNDLRLLRTRDGTTYSGEIVWSRSEFERDRGIGVKVDLTM